MIIEGHTSEDVCPLCLEATKAIKPPASEDYEYKCRRCGRFALSSALRWTLLAFAGRIERAAPPNEDKALFEGRHLLSGFTRENTLNRLHAVRLNHESARAVISGAPQDVESKADQLLIYLASASPFFGKDVGIQFEKDYPVGYCLNKFELRSLVIYLLERGLVAMPGLGTREALSGIEANPRLTGEGWKYLRDVKRRARTLTQAFVAMNSSPALTDAYEKGIKPAIERAGYRPYLIIREEFPDKIDDKILFEINRSRFVVCDFTGQRPNVYFEAGYATGRGTPAIWTCRDDEIRDLHFDTRQFPHINWSDEADLQERLYTRICVVIGESSLTALIRVE